MVSKMHQGFLVSEAPQLLIVRSCTRKYLPIAMNLGVDALSELFISKNEKSFCFVFYKLFAESGELDFGDHNKFIYRPPVAMQTLPKIRIYIAIPYCAEADEIIFDCMKRIRLFALIIQSLFDAVLHGPLAVQSIKSDPIIRHNFVYDSAWQSKDIVLPYEERFFTGSDRVCMTGPADDEFPFLPKVAILKLDQRACALYNDSHLVDYIAKRLERLGESEPNRILHLVFVPLSRKPDVSIGDRFVTKRDVAVIKSPVISFLPDDLKNIHQCFSSVEPIPELNCRSIRRVTKFDEDGDVELDYTIGGALSSLLGAAVHELGHLFKLPHATEGLMSCKGSDNLQTFLLADIRSNLGISLDFDAEHVHSVLSPMKLHIDPADMLDIIAKNQFDKVSCEFLKLSNFIRLTPLNSLCAVVYDKKERLISSKAGIVLSCLYSSDGVPLFVDYRKCVTNFCYLECVEFVACSDDDYCYTLPSMLRWKNSKNSNYIKAFVMARDGNSIMCHFT